MDAVDAIGWALPFCSLSDLRNCAQVSRRVYHRTRDSGLWATHLHLLEQQFPLDGTHPGTASPSAGLPEKYTDPRHLESYKAVQASSHASKCMLCYKELHLYGERVKNLLQGQGLSRERCEWAGYASHAHNMVSGAYARLPADRKAKLLALCTTEQARKTAISIAMEDFQLVGMRYMDMYGIRVPCDSGGEGGIGSLASTVAEYSWDDALDIRSSAFIDFIEQMLMGAKYRMAPFNVYDPAQDADAYIGYVHGDGTTPRMAEQWAAIVQLMYPGYIVDVDKACLDRDDIVESIPPMSILLFLPNGQQPRLLVGPPLGTTSMMASFDTLKCDLGGDDRPSQLQQVTAPGQPPAKRQALGVSQTKPSKSQEQQAHDQACAQAQAADSHVWGPVGGPVPRCRNGCGALRFVCGETCDGKPAAPSDTEEEDSDNYEDEDEDEDGYEQI